MFLHKVNLDIEHVLTICLTEVWTPTWSSLQIKTHTKQRKHLPPTPLLSHLQLVTYSILRTQHPLVSFLFLFAIKGNYIEPNWMTRLGCTDTPFLASCRCQTPERVRLVEFRCPTSISFFFLASPTWRRHASSEKKNHRYWQIDLSKLLILWYTLKQKFRVWDLDPPFLWPLPAAATFCPSSELDQADRRAP